MLHQSANKRFQRYPRLLSPTGNPLLSGSLPKQHQAHDSCHNSDDGREQCHGGAPRTDRVSLGLGERLAMIEQAIQVQRSERLEDNDRLVRMIRDMQCRHSAIIYDSQIRYCKSPPKLDNFNIYKPADSNKERPLKKVSSVHMADKGRPTAGKQPKNPIHEPDSRANQSPRDNDEENPEKHNAVQQDSEGDNKNSHNLQQIDNKIKQLEERISQQFAREYQKISQQIDNLPMKQTQNESRQHGELVQTLRTEISEQSIKIMNLEKTLASQGQTNKQSVDSLTNIIRQSQNSTQDGLLRIQNQFNAKIIQIQQALTRRESPLNERLNNIDDKLAGGLQKIRNLETFNDQVQSNVQARFSIVQKQISNNYDDVRGAQDTVKELQNKIKQIVAQKQKEMLERGQRQKILTREIEQYIANRVQTLKLESSKELSSRCQRIEETLVSIIQKNICFNENFIHKVAEKQKILLKKCQLLSTSESWNDKLSAFETNSEYSENEHNSAINRKKVEEVLELVRSNYEELSARNTEIESTISGVISALNDVIAKVKTIV